jgi:hypothetical protein
MLSSLRDDHGTVTVTMAVCGVVSILLNFPLGYYAYKIIKQKYIKESQYCKGKKKLRLWPYETTKMFNSSVTTISFFDGPVPTQYLHTRVAEILTQNPWLKARLCTTDGGVLDAVYASDLGDMSMYLQTVSHPVLGPSMDYDELIRYINLKTDAVILAGKDLLDKDESMFKITIVPNAMNDSFAIIFSLSHMLADGHTFYKIYDMLSMKNEVTRMVSTRGHSECRDNIMKYLLGGRSMWAYVWLLAGILLFQKFESAGRGHCKLFYIEDTAVTSIKGAYAKEHPGKFISTNDVVTSWLATHLLLSFVMLAVNFRSRIAGMTDELAGNYQGGMVMCQCDTNTPENVRNMVMSLKSAATPKNIPSLRKGLSCNGALVTNWATGSKDIVVLPKCTHIVHFPVMDRYTFLPTAMIIFRATGNKLGVAISTQPGSVTDKLMYADREFANTPSAVFSDLTIF